MMSLIVAIVLGTVRLNPIVAGVLKEIPSLVDRYVQLQPDTPFQEYLTEPSFSSNELNSPQHKHIIKLCNAGFLLYCPKEQDRLVKNAE